MENAPPEPVNASNEAYARLAEDLRRKAVRSGWKGVLLDLAISALAATAVASILSLAAGTLAAMTGLIPNSKPLGWIFLALLFPMLLAGFLIFNRDSRSRRKAYEDELNAISIRYPGFGTFYEAWQQKGRRDA